VVVAAAHGLVEDLDKEHVTAVELDDEKVPNFNGVRVGELPPAIVEVHLAEAVEHQLHGL